VPAPERAAEAVPAEAPPILTDAPPPADEPPASETPEPV
jgi:hypothetical protein